MAKAKRQGVSNECARVAWVFCHATVAAFYVTPHRGKQGGAAFKTHNKKTKGG